MIFTSSCLTQLPVPPVLCILFSQANPAFSLHHIFSCCLWSSFIIPSIYCQIPSSLYRFIIFYSQHMTHPSQTNALRHFHNSFLQTQSFHEFICNLSVCHHTEYLSHCSFCSSQDACFHCHCIPRLIDLAFHFHR